MRIWSIHPKYLDAKGIVALWRETLLAQNVLLQKTKGYKNHPQLIRFKNSENPVQAISNYLHFICDEAEKRNYNFERSKINCEISEIRIPVTKGQVEYEFQHLKNKLQIRDPKKYSEILNVDFPEVHPLFYLIAGEIESWEKVNSK